MFPPYKFYKGQIFFYLPFYSLQETFYPLNYIPLTEICYHCH